MQPRIVPGDRIPKGIVRTTYETVRPSASSIWRSEFGALYFSAGLHVRRMERTVQRLKRAASLEQFMMAALALQAEQLQHQSHCALWCTLE